MEGKGRECGFLSHNISTVGYLVVGDLGFSQVYRYALFWG